MDLKTKRIYTFQHFKESYVELLNEYLQEYVDNNELTFIEMCSAHFHNSFVDYEGIREDAFKFGDINSNTIRGLEIIESNGKQRNLSYNLILDYLQERRKKAQDIISVDEAIEPTIFKYLDQLRESDIADYDLTRKLKELTDDYDPHLLLSIRSDIDLYLFIEIDKMESNYSWVDVEEAITVRKSNGLEIPYYKTNRSELKPMLNREALLFPYEFYSVYALKAIINSLLGNAKSSPQKKFPGESNTIRQSNDLEKPSSSSNRKPIAASERQWWVPGLYTAQNGYVDKTKMPYTINGKLVPSILKELSTETGIPIASLKSYLYHTYPGENPGEKNNLFLYSDKVIELYNHCMSENITMHNDFTAQYLQATHKEK